MDINDMRDVANSRSYLSDQPRRQQDMTLDANKRSGISQGLREHDRVTSDRPRRIVPGGNYLDPDATPTKSVNPPSDEGPYLGSISGRIEAGDQKQAWSVARLGNQLVGPLPVRDAPLDFSDVTRATIWVSPQDRPIVRRMPKMAECLARC
jgi:hypothetical protein